MAKAKGKKGSFMFDHSKTCKGVTYISSNCHLNFRMEVTAKDKGPLRRIIREAVLIKNAIEGEKVTVKVTKEDLEHEIQKKIELLNSKREFHLPTLSTNATSISSLL